MRIQLRCVVLSLMLFTNILKNSELSIPIMTRSLFLKDIFNAHMSIGIAGTSGKTTTTGMLAVISKETGTDATVFCGAEVLNYSTEGIGGNFFLGNSSLLISEVDESISLGTLTAGTVTFSTSFDTMIAHFPYVE